jgi:hypothetical protein
MRETLSRTVADSVMALSGLSGAELDAALGALHATLVRWLRSANPGMSTDELSGAALMVVEAVRRELGRLARLVC